MIDGPLDLVPGASAAGSAGSPAEPVEVLGCDAAGTLAFVVARRRAADRAAADELRAVAHWADLHRVGHVGAVDPEVEEWLGADRRRSVEAASSSLGLEGLLRLSGQGAFMVEEFAVAELATALGLNEHAGRAYVGQAVELRDRLPRCWDEVMAGRLPAWKARKIAEHTIPLTAAVADAVDRMLARFASTMTLGRILRAVEAAIQRHDPELAAERAEAAAERRGVWFADQLDGTTDLSGLLDTPDAHALDRALDDVALTLGRLGDTDSRAARRARALGVLADPQHALDLGAVAPSDDEAADDDVAAGGVAPPSARRLSPMLHLHLHLGALQARGTCRCGDETGAADDGDGPVERAGHLARVDTDGRKLGARSLEVVERWVAGLTPGTALRVTPVVDLTEHLSVDSYEIPPPLRRQVAERDHHCRFPWCTNPGRYDIDHIDPYVDPDEGGPPGQTNTDNLARLCRFHHRIKTRGGWTYEHDPTTGILTWTSPQGRTYAVDEHGTYPRP